MKHEQLLRKAKFRVVGTIIYADGEKHVFEHEAISYDDALTVCESILLNNPNDEEIQEHMKDIMGNFGFTGKYCSPTFSLTVSAYMPVTRTTEIMTCDRRLETGRPLEENLDYWEIRGDDKCCSYCGSLHPERVLELIKERGKEIFEKTTKPYKGYIDRPEVPNAGFGGIKFYVHHFSAEQLSKLNQLLKQ